VATVGSKQDLCFVEPSATGGYPIKVNVVVDDVCATAVVVFPWPLPQQSKRCIRVIGCDYKIQVSWLRTNGVVLQKK
jgi:hypothetical protein